MLVVLRVPCQDYVPHLMANSIIEIPEVGVQQLPEWQLHMFDQHWVILTV